MPRRPPPSREEFPYVLEEERDLPPEEQTTFLLRTLTFREKEIATQQQIGLDREAVEKLRRNKNSDDSLDEGMITHQASQLTSARRLLNFGLLSFENFPDGNGGELEVEATGEGLRRRLSERTLDAIEPWVYELANAVTERGQLTEAQQKNS